ncbi:MAG: hypothetical protein E6K41_09435 [Gammaproteobacteria bacterium]|nr:MAG: hypothetical protein E6K41_09435 [Gammaproteobacteria bacterium]
MAHRLPPLRGGRRRDAAGAVDAQARCGAGAAPRRRLAAVKAGGDTRWPAPAKLNLFLHVTGRRADGYHELQTLFQLIDLTDTLEISVRDDGHPERPALEELDEPQQRLLGLTQAGWHIDYPLYVAVGAEMLPARLTLKRDAVRVRLLVDDWQP